MRLKLLLNLNPEKSSKLLTFSVFVFIAVIFWFLNALDKEYVSVITVPVSYHNLPHDKEISYSKTHELEVKIKGYGFDIVGRLPKQIDPLSVNLSKSAVKISESNDKYYIRTSQFKELLTALNPDVFTVVSIQPDTLFLELHTVSFKKVPVKLKGKLKFTQSYMQSGLVSFIPDSVFVYGKTDSVNQVSEVYVELPETEISESRRFNAKPLVRQGISYKIHSVAVVVPVDRFSEKILEIPINVVNIPDSLDLLTFPRNVSLRLNVPLSIYKKVDASRFTAEVDFSKIEADKAEFASPKISYKPVSDFIFSEKNMRIIPDKVDFIIENKN